LHSIRAIALRVIDLVNVTGIKIFLVLHARCKYSSLQFSAPEMGGNDTLVLVEQQYLQLSRQNIRLPVWPLERYTFGLPYLTFCQ
jgi:hypothetical protein